MRSTDDVVAFEGIPTVRIGAEIASLSGSPSQESMFVIVPANTATSPEAKVTVTLGAWAFQNDVPFRYET